MNAVDIPLFAFSVNVTSPLYTTHQDQVLCQMVHTLRVRVSGEEQDPYTYTVPATWWQHFKQQVLPEWILKRFPVLTVKHEVSVKTLYPYLKSKLPTDLYGPSITVLVNNKPIGNFLSDVDTPTYRSEWAERVEAILISKHIHDYDKCPTCKRAWFERYTP